MAKKNKQEKKSSVVSTTASASKTLDRLPDRGNGYLWSMSAAPKIDKDVHWFQLLVISFFTAFIIMIVRMADYKRPMDQFYWTNSGNDLVDFFSYYKMIAVITCAVIVLVLLIYRVFSQALAVKRTMIYIPMLVYSIMVLISYFTSDYKEFAWLGWNDRFEGTAVLLSYMILLFYVVNSVNTEKAVKWVLYPVGVTSALLGLLGISQAMNKDFFRTNLGQKLIVPNATTTDGSKIWDLIDQASAAGGQYLKFTFQNKEIYQTVYNINYVSFYLTLLIPIFGLLFIHAIMKGKEEQLSKKVIWGGLFALLIYNLIGAASSGGFLGMAIVVLLAVIILNKKIIAWWKPLSVLIIITVLVGGITYDRWLPELTNTFKVMHTESAVTTEETGAAEPTSVGHLDFLQTKGDKITVGYNGETIIFVTNPKNPSNISAKDAEGKEVAFTIQTSPSKSPVYKMKDERFKDITVRPALDSDKNVYIIIGINDVDWPFHLDRDGVQYLNGIGKLTPLDKIEGIGWKNNQEFGSGRGYIWSRTIPMMKKTIFVGYGADTYCIYFPQNDYVGKYNSGAFTSVKDIIVDKPHNMYMGMWIGTGGISLIAFLALMIIYFIQSVQVFWRNKYDRFIDFAGIGIFLGLMGFAFTGFVDDSSVSVMPMFYGLLGTGIAINMILKRNLPKKALSKAEKGDA